MTDKDLLKNFHDQNIPSTQWTHRSHLRVGYLYLKKYSFDMALIRIRNNIKQLNLVNKVEESVFSGYNETVTVAWLCLIQDVLALNIKTKDSEDFLESFMNILPKDKLQAFYSRNRLYSDRAKKEFLEPNLKKLSIL